MLSVEEDRMSWIKSIKPVKFNEVVSSNENSPVVNVVNWGRSSELNQINQTRQTQWSCFREWTPSCSECCQLRKIEWVESNQSNWSNSMKLFYRMKTLLQWILSIEEDPISWIKSIKLVKLKEVVSKNEFFPVVNVVNWGRSNELNQINQTGQTQWSCFFEWTISCNECC